MILDWVMKAKSVFIFLLIMALLASCSDSYVTWYSAGPIQVIGDKSEVWIFLEFDRQVAKNSSSYDYPNTYPVGHFQEILVLNKEGLKEKIRVKSKNNMDGVTFHPNNTSIFRYDNSFYLYSSPSMYYNESLFKWDDNIKRFVLLPDEDAFIVLKEFPSKETFWETIRGIEKMSEKYGWKVLYTDKSIGDDSFLWNKKKIVISLVENNSFFEIEIDSGDDSIVLKYEKEIKQIDRKMFKELSREEMGYKIKS